MRRAQPSPARRPPRHSRWRAPLRWQRRQVRQIASLPAATPRQEDRDDSRLWAASGRNLASAVVGSVALPMIKLANDFVNDQTHGRDRELDLEEMHRIGYEGVGAANRRLRNGFLEARSSYQGYADMLAEEGHDEMSD